VRRHAKAPFAGPTQRQADGRGRHALLCLALAISAVVCCFAPDSALATPARSLDSSFSAAGPHALAVDQSSGDVYVVDPAGQAIRRYDSAGNPQPFSALGGSNAIDGSGGADATPQGGFNLEESSSQVAVDNSGGATDGQIYVADVNHGFVDVFAPSGAYLGQLTGSSTPQGSYNHPCGVAVAPDGTLYVSGAFGAGTINRYTPSGASVADADYDAQIKGVYGCSIAVTSAGDVYEAENAFGEPGRLYKYSASDFGSPPPPAHTTIVDEELVTAVGIDPTTDDLYVDLGNKIQVYDPAGSPFYSFGSSADFGNSHGVAVKGAHGKAYVADLAHNEIDVYALEPRPYDSSFSAAGPHALAVDQSSGDVYVVDPAGQAIRRYDSAGNPQPFSALGGSNAIDGSGGADATPQGGFNLEESSSQVAVDNSGGATDGQIYVADVNHGFVDVFAPSGAYLGQLTGSSTPQGSYNHPCGVAVAPDGTLYVSGAFGAGTINRYTPSGASVADADYDAQIKGVYGCSIAVTSAGDVYEAENAFGEPGRLYKYSASDFGSPPPPAHTTIVDEELVTAVGIDPTTDDLYVDLGNKIQVYDPAGSPFYSFGSSADFGNSHGVAVKGAHGKAYVADLAHNEIDVYAPFALGAPPIVSTGAATGVGLFTATLNATVNPHGSATTDCHFDYVTDAAYQADKAIGGHDGFSGAQTAPCVPDPGSGLGDVAVSAELNGLLTGTTYHFRIVAATDGGTAVGEAATFATTPYAITDAATAIDHTVATLNGHFDPQGNPALNVTDCRFDWGTDTSYSGGTVPCAEGNSFASAAAVSAVLPGLLPGTTYHFRLHLDTASAGEAVGADQTLTTAAFPLFTDPPTTVHHTDAVLNGHFDPQGDPTLDVTGCRFDWGTDTSYAGGSVDCAEGDSFSSAAAVSALLGNLTPGVTYHYRLHLTIASGEVPGPDRTVTPPIFNTGAPTEVAAFGPDGTSASSFGASSASELAFDEANRRLYVTGETAPGVYGFDASSPPAFAPVAAFSPLPTADEILGMAVDNSATASAGHLYLTSNSTTKLYGFNSSGAALGGSFPIDLTENPDYIPFTQDQTPPYQKYPYFVSSTGVDSTGRIWVANDGGQRPSPLLRYDSSGAVQSSLTGLQFLAGFAFNSADDLYLGRGGGSGPGFGRVIRYNAPGYGSSTEIPAGDEAGDIAIDHSNDIAYIIISNQNTHNVSVVDHNNVHLYDFGDGVPDSKLSGIAVDPANHYVYLSDEADHKVHVFVPGIPQTPPTLTPADPTAITGTSATLHAKVDPETFEVTECHFEYLTDAAFQANPAENRFAGAATVPCSPDPGSGSGDVAVSAPISGLNGGTTYHFRIVASNAEPGGTATGPDQTFDSRGPKVSAQSVEATSFSDATVSAKINPAGEASTYHVEYGAGAAYGQSTPESAPFGVPGDESPHSVSVHIGGLNPGTAYHFRFVATNPGGTGEGPDVTFATYPQPPSFEEPCPNDQLRAAADAHLPDCRAYEQATPIEKHGANAQGTVNEVEASSAGGRVTFFLNGGLPTSDGSSQLSPYMASRDPAGWSSAGLLPATDPGEVAHVVGWSDDLSSTVVAGPGPGNVGSALYLRDSASGALQLGPAGDLLNDASLAGFAADTSHLIFETGAALLPEAPAGKGDNLYDLDHGALSLAARIPAGSATSCDDSGGPACVPAPEGSFAGPYNWEAGNTANGGALLRYYTQNTISRDGSRVFFTAAGTGQLYLREDGTTTTQVSASQRTTPDPNGERPAAFLAATPDGSKVFFTSCEKLTDDSTAVSTAEEEVEEKIVGGCQGKDLYSYDTGSGELTDLSVDSNPGDAKGAAVQGILGTSADGSYVYFAAVGVLASGAPSGSCNGSSPGETCNLYLSHEGTITFIAALSGADREDWGGRTTLGQKNSRVSADGRTLLFASIRSLTGYDNKSSACNPFGFPEPCQELFRYTAPDQGLACISCNPTGTKPKGDAELGALRQFLYDPIRTTLLSRNLSADGKRVFFDSPDALLPTDINGVSDVYEWEADGTGSCHTPGGCIYPISSGTSGDLSYFADASANGDHAFFFSDQQLVPFDRDQLYDVYDASVGGGLASQHASAPPTCASTACQANPAPPPEQTPASAAFSGPGNVHESAKARGCPKGKRKVRHAGKVRCQKAHKRHKRHDNRGGSK
jgi:hypothetical protein